MIRGLVLAAIGLLATACVGMPREFVSLPAVIEDWPIGFKRDLGGENGMLVARIPVGDSVADWRELVTIQRLQQHPGGLRAGLMVMQQKMVQICPEAEWRILFEDGTGLIYEWWIEACLAKEDQHEIARVMRGKASLHRIAYTRKGPPLSLEERKYWVEVLREAAVIDPETGQPVVSL